MLGNFNESAKKVLLNAKLEMNELKHPYIGSEHLLLAILKHKNNVSKKLTSYNIEYKIFREELIDIVGMGSKESEFTLYTPLLKRVIENAVIDSKENNNGEVTIEHLFASLLEEGEGVAIRILLGMNVNLDELYSEFSYKISVPQNKKLLLEDIGINLTKKALNNELDPVIGRNSEIHRTLEILLRRSKNNPVLVGEAGVGKTAIVEGIASLIASGKVPMKLKNKKIISLEMASLVAGTKYRGEFEDRIKKILTEVSENDDIILFVDEIHTIIGAGGAEGAIDASNIFKPALARNKLRLIGATTLEEYRKTIEKDKALDRRFQKITITEPSIETTKNIIATLKPIYENYHNVKISNEILNYLLEMTNKYIFNRKNPDKTIDILDEVCSKVSLKENKYLKKYNVLQEEMLEIIAKKKEAIISNRFKVASSYKEKENIIMNSINELELKLYTKNTQKVTKDDILKVIAAKYNIPYQILENNFMFSSLKTKLNKKLFDQEEAINLFCESLQNKNNIFTFKGSIGVGKGYLTKLLSEYLGYKLLKIDLSQYKDVNKIIGASPGYIGYDEITILEDIKNNPYTLVVLANPEETKEEVINLFINGFKEQKIVDNKGTTINLKNAILIILYNTKTKTIGFNKANINDTFRTDSEIITFKDLTESTFKKILKTKKKMSPKEVNDIIAKSDFQKLGATKIEKLIKKEQQFV